MPLKLFNKWPRLYGFEICGQGPSYVISVEKGSLAFRAGLMPGDQLLEVGGQDVTTLSVDEIRLMSKSISKQPPELEVVSCLQTIVIKPDPVAGYGFSVLNEKPVIIGSVSFGGPAFQSGLRAGDIILEVNGKSPVRFEKLQSALSQRSGVLNLLTIPIGRSSNMVQMDKNLSQINAPDTRFYRAKDLHNKLESLLGGDYKRKIAVVSALKRYAEDRDITILCKTLNKVLWSDESRNIITTIRLLIPPTQRLHFDSLINKTKYQMTSSDKSSHKSHSITNHPKGKKKLIQVVREGGSFGFVIKSSSPAYIESIDPGGAAEKAGLRVGDFMIKLNNIDIRKCDHDKMVHMLQESGSAPTLEILRCSDYGSIKSASTLSSSSCSSHDSTDDIFFNETITNSNGDTFLDKAAFLLTPKERSSLKKALKQYHINKDITELFDNLSILLETPSKKTLWQFVIAQLPPPHQEFVSHRVDAFEIFSLGAENVPQVLDLHGFPSPFLQQVDDLLTYTERIKFLNSLKTYSTDYELSPLLKNLELILDTPSKKTLWQLVMPMLTPDDQDLVDGKMGQDWTKVDDELSSIGSPGNEAWDKNGDYIERPLADGWRDEKLVTGINSDEEIVYGNGKIQGDQPEPFSSDDDEENDSTEESGSLHSKWSLPKGLSNSQGIWYNESLLRELGETKRAVEEIRQALIVQGKTKDNDAVSDSDLKRYVTVIPVNLPVPEKDLQMNNGQIHNDGAMANKVSAARPQLHTSHKGLELFKGSFEENILTDSHINYSSDSSSDVEEESSPSKIDGPFMNPIFASSHTALNALPSSTSAVKKPAKKLEFGLKSIRIGNQSWKNEETQDAKNIVKQKQEPENEKEFRNSSIYPPPVPPPPPLLPSASKDLEDNSNKMSVKRINWEKLDNKSVQNTIWEKLNDHDLPEVIRFLELETQFSTKPTYQRDKKKRKEILIMDSKKAYNISILLGHLKMPVTDIRKALYSVDEKILSPELLGQLLAFVPDETEISKYKMYAGDKSLLTKPDQFAYQMSLVGNYEERLRGLLFKANFNEKCHELKQNLNVLKDASLELRSSKKLACLLEIILAMGNYMNKGNSRVGEAAGFRITFLKQLETTKTSDNKSSFLHFLADAAYNKFPQVLSFGDEISTVEKAAKVSIDVLVQDIQELGKSLKDTTEFLKNMSVEAIEESEDHFREVFGKFLVDATHCIESIKQLHQDTMAEFSATISYFGEDPSSMNTEDFFEIFTSFIHNFEKAHSHNIMFKKR
ncbi:unnamed protein product [Lymnaea stagnalis]|uniref:Delphilin n=1 Tax=Lymnaea stagnalis TaxID=6523 RepID=A0AAV2HEK0_LYMST